MKSAKSKAASILLILLSISASVCNEINFNVCANKSGKLKYEGNNRVTHDWMIKGENCTNEKSSLLLRFTRMRNMKIAGRCSAQVTSSGFPSDHVICSQRVGTCYLLLSSNASCVDISPMKGCRSIIHVWTIEAFPQSITLSIFYTLGSVVRFEMDYTYVSDCEEYADVTTTVSDFSTAAVATTDGGSRMSTTTEYTSVENNQGFVTTVSTAAIGTADGSNRITNTEYISVKNNQETSTDLNTIDERTDEHISDRNEIYIIIIAILSVLLAAAIVSTAILARFLSTHCKKNKNKDNGSEASQEIPETSEAIYTVVKKPGRYQQSSQREMVVNELYDISS